MTIKSDDAQQDVQHLSRAIGILREHFDTVHIFVTRRLPSGDTRVVVRGDGNWFARYGQIVGWVKYEDARIAKDEVVWNDRNSNMRDDDEPDGWC